MSHKNTLRSLFKHIQGLEDSECKRIIVPNAVPIVYEFDQEMNYIQNYTLDNQINEDYSREENPL